MVTKSKSTVAAGEFKARCLAILDDVQRTRQSVVVTKRGKPVARLVPVEEADDIPSLRGSVLYEGDLLSPMLDAWGIGDAKRSRTKPRA
jgi:prevent-host-death family protein